MEELESDIKKGKEARLTFWEVLKIDDEERKNKSCDSESNQEDDRNNTNSLMCCTIL